MKSSLPLTAALVLLLSAAASPQSRPDFSGAWVLADGRSSLLGETFTAKQDAKTLRLDLSVAAVGRPVTAVYNLDGSESKNLNPNLTPGVADEAIYSRVAWEDNKLVILTRGTTLVKGKPTESRRVIWIDATGLLTIERTSEGYPAIRSVYRRAQ